METELTPGPAALHHINQQKCRGGWWGAGRIRPRAAVLQVWTGCNSLTRESFRNASDGTPPQTLGISSSGGRASSLSLTSLQAKPIPSRLRQADVEGDGWPGWSERTFQRLRDLSRPFLPGNEASLRSGSTGRGPWHPCGAEKALEPPKTSGDETEALEAVTLPPPSA